MTHMSEVPTTTALTALARLDLACRALDGTLVPRVLEHPAWDCYRPTCQVCAHWRGRLQAVEDRRAELQRQVERGDDERAHLPAAGDPG